MGGRAVLPCPSVAALAAFMVATVVAAEEARPANTLMDMRRQFGACMSGSVLVVRLTARTCVFLGPVRVQISLARSFDQIGQLSP